MLSVKNTAKAGALNQLAWSDVEYPFGEFLDRFHLPQLVKIQDGFCSPNEVCCLSTDQVLTVHAIKIREKVLARDQTNRKLHIPLDCSQKIELCPQGAPNVLGTEKHLRQHKFVRVLQDQHRSSDRRASTACTGMKLEVVRVRGAGIRQAHVRFKNEEGDFVRLPFSETTTFQPLVDGREYYLKEVSTMELPVYFKFVDSPKTTEESVFSSSLGVLKLEKTYRDTTVIYTITNEGTDRIFACPRNTPITVCVPRGALEEDEKYVNIRQSFLGHLNLPKIDNLELENIYENPDDIREYKRPDALIQPQPCSGTSQGRHDVSPQREGSIKKMAVFDHAGRQLLASAISRHFNGSTQNTPLQEGKTLENTEDGEANIYESIGEEERVTSVVVPRPPLKPQRHIKVRPPAPQSETRAEKDVVEQKFRSSKPPLPVKPKPGISSPSSADESNQFEIPDDLTQMSVREVSKFLKKVHLGDFVHVFKENDVDGEMLVCMTTEDMNALSMNAFQVKKLLKLTKGWRPKV